MRTRPYSLAVIGFDELDLLDVAGPLEVISSAGRKWNWRAIKAELVAAEAGWISTRAQLGIGPAMSFASLETPELVLIPGGYGARKALEDPAILAYLASIRLGVSTTLAIGWGVLLAARAGLLRECEVAVTPALAKELTELDSSITPNCGPGVVTSERAITAASSGSAVELGLELVARLLGKSQALGTARELGYAWGVETLSVDIVPGTLGASGSAD
jgi:transcriptional regulator GlxA family with amidase domain